MVSLGNIGVSLVVSGRKGKRQAARQGKLGRCPGCDGENVVEFQWLVAAETEIGTGGKGKAVAHKSHRFALGRLEGTAVGVVEHGVNK